MSDGRDQCRKIISAVRAYQQKQGALPLPQGSPPDEAHAFQMDAAMFAALSGETVTANTGGVNYFMPMGLSGRTLQDLKKGAYYACFDFNGDSRIPNPATPGKSIEQDVLVLHAGKDGDPQTWADNHWAWLAEK